MVHICANDEELITDWAVKWKNNFKPHLCKQTQKIVFNIGQIKAAHPNSFFSDNFASSTAVDKHIGVILDGNSAKRNILIYYQRQ